MPMFAKVDNVLKVVGKKKEDLNASLETGMYSANIYDGMRGVEYDLKRMDRYDTTEVIKVGVFNEAYDYITSHFDPIKVNLRKEMGMMNKMNVMFKGDPGTGKTHLACTIAAELVRKNEGIGVVINEFTDANFDEFAQNLRINDDDDRLIVLVLDEMEKTPGWKLRSPKFLGFLDGALSKKNVVVFATVNETDDLPGYLTNRPGRFEKIYDFEFQDEEVLRTITLGLVPERYKDNTAVIDYVVSTSLAKEIKTIDHLRFLIIDHLYNLEKGNEITPIEKVEKEDKKILGEVEVGLDDIKEGVVDEGAVLDDINKRFAEIIKNHMPLNPKAALTMN